MSSMFDYNISNPIALVGLSFVLAVISSIIVSKTSECSNNMKKTLMILPPLVCMALMAVNGSVGTSVAILGVFSLVRFRSIPGDANDIVNIFLSMVIGLLSSTGYVVTTTVLTLCSFIVLIIAKNLVSNKNEKHYLKIIVPDDMNFQDVFEKVLENYFEQYKLHKIKTSNMGTLFDLEYEVIAKKDMNIKKVIDDIRAMNGNLTVSYYRAEIGQTL